MVREVLDRLAVPTAWVGPLIVFVLTSSLAGGIWLGQLQANQDQILQEGTPLSRKDANDIVDLQARTRIVELMGAQITINSNRLSTLEAQLTNIKEDLSRIEAKLDKQQ